MTSVFPCYAPADKEFAAELAAFLERGAEVRVFLDEGQIESGETLITKAVDGMQADAILLILSPDSCPEWRRPEWEPALCKKPREGDVRVATVKLRDCVFPPLLPRPHFELTGNRLAGCRQIKRWLMPELMRTAFEPRKQACFEGREAEIEQLCMALADKPGAIALTGKPGSGKTSLALEFARRCERDFSGIVWVQCGGESLAATCGEMAAQLGITLAGDEESNLSGILSFCGQRRLLVVLDDAAEYGPRFIAAGVSSTLLIAGRAPAGCASMELDSLPEQTKRPRVDGLSPCGASPFRLWLAKELGGIAETDSVIQLDSRFYVLRSGARLEPSEEQCRAHAEAVSRQFAHWAEAEAGCAADLPQLRRALQWALSRDEEDGDAWLLACQLARRGTALLKQNGRQAETFELLQGVAQAAILRDDRRMLEDCSRDEVWILESWGKYEEAEALDINRRALYADQLDLPF